MRLYDPLFPLALTFLLIFSPLSLAAPHERLADIDRWADVATQALIDHYWSGPRSPFSGFGWGNAQAWDAFMDAVERTGGVDSPYYPYIDQLFRRQSAINPTFINEFNDDMAWWALASLRAYDISGDPKYFDRALLLWNTIIRSWDDELGGGIWWKNNEKTGKNACINSPASIIASKLYQLTGDEEYLEWAVKLYEWVKEHLAPTGLVWDNVNREGTIWHATFTYNQGTYIGAAVELYKITGDPTYLEDARRTAHLSMTRLIEPTGVLKDEGQGDGGGFKGIFVRYLGSLIEVDPEPEAYIHFLVKNAVTVGERGFNELNLIGPNWARPHRGDVELLTHVSGVMLLNLTARVLAEEVGGYGLAIHRPAWDALVMADEPIVFEVAPWVEVAEVTVLEDGVEVYRGPAVPSGLTLSLPVQEEGEERAVTVRVTGVDGQVWQRTTRFWVRRLALDLPELEFGRVRGDVPLTLDARFRPDEEVASFELALVAVGQDGPAERIVFYESEHLPGRMVLETRNYPDGAYDLQLTARDSSGGVVSQVARRIVISNWDTKLEHFRPPFTFFGITSDSLLTHARSDGWAFHTEDPGAFFGDEHRIAPVATGQEEYLIWHYPGLRRFVLTVYAADAASVEAVRASASPDMEVWLPVDVEMRVVTESEAGWVRVELTGAIDAGLEAAYLKIAVEGLDPAEAPFQFGELVLMRPGDAER